MIVVIIVIAVIAVILAVTLGLVFGLKKKPSNGSGCSLKINMINGLPTDYKDSCNSSLNAKNPPKKGELYCLPNENDLKKLTTAANNEQTVNLILSGKCSKYTGGSPGVQPKPSPPNPGLKQRYNCNNGVCEGGTDGTYSTKEECTANCKQTYDCMNGKCVWVDEHGDWSSHDDCTANCKYPDPTQLTYNCNNGVCEVSGTNGKYKTQEECTKNCKPGSPKGPSSNVFFTICSQSEDPRCGGCPLIKQKIDNYTEYCKGFDKTDCPDKPGQVCYLDNNKCTFNNVLTYKQWINDLFDKSGNTEDICKPLHYMDKNNTTEVPLSEQGISPDTTSAQMIWYGGGCSNGTAQDWRDYVNYDNAAELTTFPTYPEMFNKKGNEGSGSQWTYSSSKCGLGQAGWVSLLPN